MKKYLFSIFVFLLLSFAGQAQFKIGVRAGLSTSNLDKEIIEESSLKIAIEEAKYGFHIGFIVRGHLSENFYLQPELLFNSNTVDFEVDDPNDGLVEEILNEKYQYLDIPLMIGYKIGILRLEAGPVGHAYLASKTELDVINEYEQRFNNFTLGYQAGIGLDLWQFLVDVRYEGNFNDFGEHIHIAGEQVKFSQTSARWVLTVGYLF